MRTSTNNHSLMIADLTLCYDLDTTRGLRLLNATNNEDLQASTVDLDIPMRESVFVFNRTIYFVQFFDPT